MSDAPDQASATVATPDANGWLPIATAPRGGRQILVCGPTLNDGEPGYAVVEWFQRSDGSCFWEFAHGTDNTINIVAAVLTHWMPLPLFPEAK